MENQNRQRRRRTQVLAAAVTTTLIFALGGCHWIVAVSQSSDGALGNSDSGSGAMSYDGRYVAFWSTSSNLVPQDTNNVADIFLHDTVSRTTTRISQGSNGNEANDASYSPVISHDGRYIAFYSLASNLVPGDTNGKRDIFVHDTSTGVNTRISTSPGGAQGNNNSYWPSISADGRFVAFSSAASNLVPGGTNGFEHIFVHDRSTGTTTQVSVDSAGNQGNNASYSSTAISADGRYVAFSSDASNLVAGDVSRWEDIFVHDRVTGTTTRVSVSADGIEANGSSKYASISADGRYIAFWSRANNLVPDDTNGAYTDIFVHDRETAVTSRVSIDSEGNQGNGYSSPPIISADGRFVAFASEASNLVQDDFNGVNDVFVHDRLSGNTRRASLNVLGEEGSGSSSLAAVSPDGRYIAFGSRSDNLVPDGTDESSNLFIRALPAFSISSVFPDHLPIGATTAVTISGNGFLPGVTPWFNRGRLSNIVIVDENTITADFTIPDTATSGAYDMGINLFGTGPGAAAGVSEKCAGCVTLF